MPSGIVAPSPASLGPNGSQDLQNATIPLQTDPAWKQIGDQSVGPFPSLIDPRPEWFSGLGVWAPSEDLATFDKIHVIPRRRDLGLVLSEQDIEVEVWNAFLDRAQTLNQITQSGPVGVEIIDHLGQPAHFAASDSEIYTLKVLAEGDPNIDNIVTWEFVGIASSGTDIRLLGFRIIPVPFQPNMRHPIVETYGYMTDVITSFRGQEQRVQLRAVPVGTISYTILLLVPRDAQMLGAILYGNQPRAFGVGRWQFRTVLTAAASPGDLEIFCSTANIPFEPGGLVFLWIDPYTWEAQTISSVASDRLTLTTPIQNSWASAQTAVMPMVVGRLSAEEPLTWESLLAMSSAFTFNVDGFRP